MNALLYGIALQFKMDLRSRSLLITCYLVPLLFFIIMSGVFTSIMPEAKETLIPSMTVMGISLGAIIGVPPSLSEIYGTDLKKLYLANHVPLSFGVAVMTISAFLHLTIMSIIILFSAPILYHALPPSNIPLYLISLLGFIIVSLSIACILGLFIKDQSKLTMFSQLIFLPSIMLSGIMFPADLLPSYFAQLGNLLPATWGYQLLSLTDIQVYDVLPLIIIFVLACGICIIYMKKKQSE